MIEVFEGLIGGGKTLSAMERIVGNWRAGGTVATNVRINWDGWWLDKGIVVPEKTETAEWITGCVQRIEERFGERIRPEQLLTLTNEQISTFWEFVPAGTAKNPVLCLIDEADVWIPNASYGGKVHPQFWSFLKQSRKMGTDVIFITQAVKNLSSQVARLCQFVWRFKDMEKMKIKIPILGEFGWPFGAQILQIQCDRDGKTVMARRFWRKDPWFFGLYDTNALYCDFKRLDAITEPVKIEKIAKKEVEPPAWALPLAFAALILVAFL